MEISELSKYDIPDKILKIWEKAESSLFRQENNLR